MEDKEEMLPSDLATTKLNLMRFNLRSFPHEIIGYSQLEEIYAWENQIR
jgi:hypothetical protein